MQLSDAKVRYPKDLSSNNPNIKQSARPSIMTASNNNRNDYLYLDIDSLIPYRNQARKTFDVNSLKELAETIKQHGIRQPLTVILSDPEKGIFEVVSGERRLRAAKLAGLTQVPCIILKDGSKAEEIAIIENTQREDLHPVELYTAYKSLLDNGYCQNAAEIAEKTASNKSSISEILAIRKIAEDVQDMLIKEKISNRSVLRKLISIEDSVKQREFLCGYLSKDNQVKKVKNTKGLYTKSKVLEFVIEDGEFKITKNAVSKLDQPQKAALFQLINQIF